MQGSLDLRSILVRNVIEEAVDRFRKALDNLCHRLEALQTLSLLDLEQWFHREVGARCLDFVMGSVIRALHYQTPVIERANALVQARPHSRLQKSEETVVIRLLGGSQFALHSPYFLQRPPRGPGRPRARGRRGKAGNGFYPYLEAQGIYFRVTPAVASEVARTVAISTVDEAQSTLGLRGLVLDRKVITRIVRDVADRSLDFATWMEEQVKLGERGFAAVGKRIGIGIDGGRIRTVVHKKGRRRKSRRRAYTGTWREPKVIVIYEIDEDGRRKKRGLLRYDATLRDADGIFERLVTTLCALGADKAAEWVILGDGAGWIWDRIDKLVTSVGYKRDLVTEVVDFYHGVQRLHAIAATVKGWSESQQNSWVTKARRDLYRGNFDAVADCVSRLYRGRNAKKIRKLFSYFQTHRERMRYNVFRRKSIPMGSGAVESCIRRVVNLRMKGNGVFWLPCNAERLLRLRTQLLAGRWDALVKNVLQPKELWTLKAA